jgi:hypothetical protein
MTSAKINGMRGSPNSVRGQISVPWFAVMSVDTKKLELVGDFKNAGREWWPKGEPQKMRTHDFMVEVVQDRAPDVLVHQPELVHLTRPSLHGV